MDHPSQNERLEDVIRQMAQRDPQALAMVSSRFNALSYAQLVSQIDQVAGVLARAGWGKSSRIAIAVKDNAAAALVIVTVACAAVAVPLDPNLAAAELEMRLNLLEVDVLCTLAGEIGRAHV